ncbi:MAG: serine protease [Puniceicoccaceae bacterium]|nr:MAG: serine protease [Puniceicoccaceae bacterium]
MTWVVLLFVLGIILILFEVMVPGGILGLLGGLALLAGGVLAFVNFGLGVGLLAFLAAMAVLGLSLLAELKFLPRTAVGQRLFLHSQIEGSSQKTEGFAELIGRPCEALTALSPTGVVLLDGKKYEAFSQSGFIERGARLTVTRYDNFRLIVSK